MSFQQLAFPCFGCALTSQQGFIITDKIYIVMREPSKKAKVKALSQAFTGHQQTALKEFMVFNTILVILQHIIEQALRQRALLQET